MTSLIFGILKNDTNELIYKTEIDSLTQKTNLWLPKCKVREAQIGNNRYISLHIKAGKQQGPII